MLTIALLLQAATPTPETERLGLELAQHGMLASMLPVMAAKETDELVAAHPELSDADKAALRREAKATYVGMSGRLLQATGREYATRLTPAEMRDVIAFYRTPAAVRYQMVQPQVIAGTVASIGTMDFKKDALAAFCASTGKLCPAR